MDIPIFVKPKISERCKTSSMKGDKIASCIIAKITENHDFNFHVGDIPDCGYNMNAQFLNYYKCRYFESDEFDSIKFNEEASKFLLQNNENYIKFFRSLSPVFFIVDKDIIDERTLHFALNVIKEFENKNKAVKIHKGSPYHMLGISNISNGKLLKGFLLVHQALDEDKRIGHRKGAALPLLTMDSQKVMAGKTLLREVEYFIFEKLRCYRISGRGKLTFDDDLKSKFLGRQDIRDIVFQFVYTAFRLKEMVDIDKELMQNDFAALSQKDIIFDFCTIIENIIKTQNKYPNEDMETKKTLYPLLEFLSKKESLIIHEKNNLGGLNDSISKTNFPDTLQSLLYSQYTFRGNKKPIDEDLAITYILRNNIHEIKSWPIIYQNFDNIIERILYVLFFSIENLYNCYYWDYEVIISKNKA